MSRRVRIAIVGVGKIARGQHLPALAASADFELVAAASHSGKIDGVANFPTITAMIAATASLEAVALCTPPKGRHLLAMEAMAAGLHVLLEKPPGATLGEVAALEALARQRQVALFATWHSREAAGVEPARYWLASREIRAVRVRWKEDVRVWHPGQDWIFAAGGLGVFDPGINALSIVTRILPGSLVLEQATLQFPANRAAPIAAELRLRHAGSAPVDVEFDFLQTGPQSWDIEVDTDAGMLRLARGGADLALGDGPYALAADSEYPRLYSRFHDLIDRQAVDVDSTPLRLVADAFLLGRRVTTQGFEF